MPYFFFFYRLEVSPKVESSSDVSYPVPSCSPVPLSCSSASPSDHATSDTGNHANPFITSASPTSTSTSNPLPTHMQRNPFIKELIAEELQRSPVDPCPSLGSSPFFYTHLQSKQHYNTGSSNVTLVPRERPRPVARQISLPVLVHRETTQSSCKVSAPRSMSETDDWEDSFDALASVRFNVTKGHRPQREQTKSLTSFYGQESPNAPKLYKEDPPPLPPRRVPRAPGNDVFSDGWLHRGQELAVHKEAYLLSQTGVASLQHGREAERHNAATDPHARKKAAGSRPYTNMNSSGFLSEETLKKFKYEPLEDDADCWGGMLYEQDLYGRVCRGGFRKPTANLNLSLNAENRPTAKLTPTNPAPFLDNQPSVADLLSVPVTPLKPNSSTTPTGDRKSSPEAVCAHNTSLPPTPGDFKLNASTSDFSFIDSEGSSQSEAVDTLQGIESLSVTLPKPSEDLRVGSHHAETPRGIFTLKDTYIPESNSSFEVVADRITPLFKANSQNCLLESNNGMLDPSCGERAPQIHNQNCLESSEIVTFPDDLINTQKTSPKEFDDNGNLRGKICTLDQPGSFPAVVSARLRPKGVQSNTGSPNNHSKSGEREFEELLSLVQNFSGVSEGPLSYQPTKSALYTLMISNQPADLHENSLNQSQTLGDKSKLKGDVTVCGDALSFLSEKSKLVQTSVITFEDLHAKVAPNFKPASKMEPSFRTHGLSSCSVGCARPESARANPSQQTTLPCNPSINHSQAQPRDGAVAPCTSAPSTTSNTDPSLVDANQSLLPEKTEPASNLPYQESR